MQITTYPKLQTFVCHIQREADLYLAVSRGRELSNSLGFREADRTRVEIVILELTRNMLIHAGRGELHLSLISDHGYQGVMVEAIDNGPGIPDINLALSDGFSTTKTLGAGLPGVRRLMDVFDIQSVVGIGTAVTAIKWQPTGSRSARR